MKLKSHFIYITICFVLVVALLYSLNGSNVIVEQTTKCTTDTFFIFKTDTLIEYRPLWKERTIVDTFYIENKSDSLIALPIAQKRYHKQKSYDLWISGIEPLSMDSIKIYEKTEYKTITNTITNTIVENKPRIYVLCGLNAVSGTFMPNMNISLATKKKWLYSLEIGLNENNSIYYGGKIGYRIF